MRSARSSGIDAFALNIGTDPSTDAQLDLAYESAAANDMKVFISFDFNSYGTGNVSAIAEKIEQYAHLSAQLTVEGKVFASSFGGNSLDVSALASATGIDLLFVPNFQPGVQGFESLEGAFNWMAWPNDGNNRAPTSDHNMTVADGDREYLQALSGRPYIARKDTSLYLRI
jgi:hypothetical protein